MRLRDEAFVPIEWRKPTPTLDPGQGDPTAKALRNTTDGDRRRTKRRRRKKNRTTTT